MLLICNIARTEKFSSKSSFCMVTCSAGFAGTGNLCIVTLSSLHILVNENEYFS